MASLIKTTSRAPSTADRQSKGFVELIARSNFSFLQGASHPHEMVEEALRHGYRGLALCDLNGLYGVVRGHQAAQHPSLFTASVHAPADFLYLVGSEVTLEDGSTVVLIPLNLNGYSNLCRLLTLGKRNVAKYFSKIRWDDLLAQHEDLLIFPLPPISEDRFLQLQKVFQDRLYLPVWRDLTWESLNLSKPFFDWEQKHGAQLFVTQRPFMHSQDCRPLFDLLTCIHHHTTFEKAQHILIQNSERHLRALHELQWLWRDRLDLLETTVEIAERVEFRLSQIRYRYPQSRLPPGVTPTQHLRVLTDEGLRWRYPQGTPDKVRALVEHELAIIAELEYEDYFLTLREICDFARRKGILYQGRGSAANSVVCFALGLTSVNPVQVDMLFERFISKERGEPPDIDIDFEHERREEVIQYIYQTYDADHAAMVCTVIRYRTRMALRETGKTLGIPTPKINAIIKFMGRDGFRRLLEAPDIWKKFGLEEWTWKALMGLAQKIHGLPRHIGIHTGGFLITHDLITHFVPVEKATMNGRYVIQWNKDDVNDLKLMKIDVLSLGMLTALRKCLQLLKRHRGIDWNLSQIPPDDEKTYDMICKADTVGVFQIESRAQMNTLPRMRPRNYYDLVVEVAIVRPGPLQGGMVHPYLRRRAGLEKPAYPHPDLEPVLRKTLGVPIFQEQVMQMAVIGARFTPGEADELRRIMSAAWRRKGTMDGIRAKIMRGMKDNGYTEATADQVYRTIEGFASYGFPESHAASFALLTYASCFIKCHFPDVFVCALLNSQPMGFYPPRVLVHEAQRNGVEFLPLCVQFSAVEYEIVRTQQIRVGLISLYGFHRQWMERIVFERAQQGPFTSLQDFIQRATRHGGPHEPLNKSALLKLASAGALQCFGLEPRRLLWHIESLSLDSQSFLWGQPQEHFPRQGIRTTPSSPQNRSDKFSDQFPDPFSKSRSEFFQEPLWDEDAESQSQLLPEETPWEELRREHESKGFSIDHHPLAVLRAALEEKSLELRRQGYLPFSSSKELRDCSSRTKVHGCLSRTKVRLAGLSGIMQRPPTAKGMCFITLEDEFGFMNIIVTPDVYQKDRITIYSRTLLEVWGQIERSGPLLNIKAERVLPLNEGIFQRPIDKYLNPASRTT